MTFSLKGLLNICIATLMVVLVFLVFSRDTSYDLDHDLESHDDHMMIGRSPQGAELDEDTLIQQYKGKKNTYLSIRNILYVLQRSINNSVISKQGAAPSEEETDQDYMTRFHAVNTSSAVVNPHPFTYIIPPKHICDEKDLFLLIYVHTAPANYRRRVLIRDTWGNPKNFQDTKVRILFVMGIKPGETSLQEALYFEQEQYGDLLQEDFVDSYRNLTYKGIAALKYISTDCQEVPFILKIDDDVFVNIFSLVLYLKTLVSADRVHDLLSCLLWTRMPVIREEQSKWYVPKTEWKDDTFPTYCSGSAYIISGDVVAKMYHASFYTPFYWVDDLYITGLLPLRIGLKQVSISNYYELNFRKFQDKYKDNPEEGMKSIFSHFREVNKAQTLWNVIASRRNGVLSGVEMAGAWWKNDTLVLEK